MNPYSFLAQSYDDLTSEIPYDLFIEFYNSIFAKSEENINLILDLCCGTGTISCAMAKLGYDMISVDASSEMLIEAQNKALCQGVNPLYICQQADELDLYGCVDACISSLDSVNYFEPKVIDKVFKKLHLFIRKNGFLIFDIRSEQWLKSLDNTTSIIDGTNSYCVWNTYINSKTVTYKMDIFSRVGDLYKRESEIHNEYIYTDQDLKNKLIKAGFTNINIISDGPQSSEGRLFIICNNT